MKDSGRAGYEGQGRPVGVAMALLLTSDEEKNKGRIYFVDDYPMLLARDHITRKRGRDAFIALGGPDVLLILNSEVDASLGHDVEPVNVP